MSRQQKRAHERKKKKTLHKLCLAAGEGVGRAVAFTFALATNAFAAEPKKEETFELPPVVVEDQGGYYVPQSSLPRFPEPLKDTPQSITIVPQQVIREQGGTTLRDALRNVSGIGIQAGEGGGAQGDNFTLRGFNARNDIFIDGVRDQGTYFRDAFNIEAVEVLKGPSSTFFGRGSTGGIINQSSKTPRLDRSYSGAFNGGTDVYFRGTADINQPLNFISPTAALRLNLMAHRNDVAERDVIENMRFGFAPSIAFGLGTPTQLTFSYLVQREDNIPDYGFPFGPDGEPVRVKRHNFYGFKDDDYERTLTNIGTARLDHRFSDQLSLRNTIRFSHVDREVTPSIPQLDLATLTVNRSRPRRDTQESILSNQTDLTAKFDTYSFKHTLTTGMEVSRESFDVLRFASNAASGVPPTDLFNPNFNQSLAGATKTVNAKSDTTSLGFGIFAADQIKLNRYFDIVGGLRWDYFGTKFDNKISPDNFDRADKMLSYRGGLIFHPTQSQSYYFSYGTSFNPSAEALALNANNQGTAPEENEIYEIGGKLELTQALSLQGAVFRINKKNARVNDPILGIQVLDGKQRVQGFEIGLAGRVLPGWNVFTGYTFLDSEFVKSTDPEVVGNDLQNTPRHSANLWTTYDFLENWQIGGGPTFVGGRYANNQNTNKVDSYVRWDSTIAYKVNEKVELRLNAQNMTNAFFFESVHPSHIVPGAGRTFIFSTSVKF
jgi:catecholate siderophore receptor